MMRTHKVNAYIRTGPHYNPGFFINAMSAGKATRHFFLQSPGPFACALIARAHGVEKSDVLLRWL